MPVQGEDVASFRLAELANPTAEQLKARERWLMIVK
jgi:hypothetical protein